MMFVWKGLRWYVSGSKTYQGQLYYMLAYCGLDRDGDKGWVRASECEVTEGG